MKISRGGVVVAAVGVLAVALTAMWSRADLAERARQRADEAQSALPALPVPDPAPAARRAHFYDVHEGAEYGYTAALSDADRQAGKAANTIVMVGYAGERDGRHQVHVTQGQVITAFECGSPCEVIKVMSVVDADGLRSQVQTEHLRAAPNVIATMALRDAMNGQLQRYVQHYDERPYEMWIDANKGLTRKPVRAAP